MADTQAKIVLSAEDRTARVFAGLRSNLGGLQSQVGSVQQSFLGLAPSIVGAFGVAGISAFFGRVVDGIDNLNDLADATGSSVEKLSGLEDIGARTGTGIDTVSQAVIKLNKNLLDAQDPTSQAAALFKQLGLNAGELSKLDPSDALLRVARALDGFEQNANRGQFQLALLGKSTRELAPFLKDLAEAGEINSKVTSEQAAEAEKFNKQLFALQKNATDAAREIAGPVVESINALTDRFREARKEGQGLFSFLGSEYKRIAQEQMQLLGFGGAAPGRQKVSGLVTSATPDAPKPDIGNISDAQKYLENLLRQLQDTKNISVEEKVLADIQAGRLKLAKDESAQQLLDIARQIDQAKRLKDQGKDRLTDAQKYFENLQRQLQGTQDLTVAETVLADIQAGRLKLAKGESAQPLLDIAAQIDQAKRREEQFKAEAEQVRELRAETERLAVECQDVLA